MNDLFEGDHDQLIVKGVRHNDLGYSGHASKQMLERRRNENGVLFLLRREAWTSTNILVVETKNRNGAGEAFDLLKLKAFRTEFGYEHASFLRLPGEENPGSRNCARKVKFRRPNSTPDDVAGEFCSYLRIISKVPESGYFPRF